MTGFEAIIELLAFKDTPEPPVDVIFAEFKSEYVTNRYERMTRGEDMEE